MSELQNVKLTISLTPIILINAASSPFWIPSSLVYTDSDSNEFGRFDPNLFDELEEPPPVHILYPRPAYGISQINRSIFVVYILCYILLSTVWLFYENSLIIR